MIFTDWISWLRGRTPETAAVKCKNPEENRALVAERERTLALFLGEVAAIDQFIHSAVGQAIVAQLDTYLAFAQNQVIDLIADPEKNEAALKRMAVEVTVARELRNLFSTERIQEAHETLDRERRRVAAVRERIDESIASQPVMGKEVE